MKFQNILNLALMNIINLIYIYNILIVTKLLFKNNFIKKLFVLTNAYDFLIFVLLVLRILKNIFNKWNILKEILSFYYLKIE